MNEMATGSVRIKTRGVGKEGHLSFKELHPRGGWQILQLAGLPPSSAKTRTPQYLCQYQITKDMFYIL
jgi:hypothetical protein